MNSKSGRKFKEPDIINIKSKLHAIGLDIEYVTKKEDIIIYLIYYLGVMTIEQLCVLFGVLETSIKTSIARILKNANIIEIKKDDINNSYYLPTRKTLAELKKFCDVNENRNYRNIRHLSKINDFFLTLFKSNCDKVTIEYEKSIGNEELSIRTDAVIYVEKGGNEYEFILEQDNNTEKVTRIIDKIDNYFNLILHDKFCPEKIRYYIFRFDVYLNKNHITKFEELLKRTITYKIYLMKEINEIQEFYDEVKDGVKYGAYSEEDYEEQIDNFDVDYSDNPNIFLQNISAAKSKMLRILNLYKRANRIEFSCRLLKDRINKVKTAMFNEITIKPFYDDSINTLYHDITGHKRYEFINSKLDAEEILLRTNILCGDRKVDYILRTALFNDTLSIYSDESHILKGIIKEAFGHHGINFNNNVKQIFKKVGYQSLCFSNYCTVHLNDQNFDIDCILLMPSISISDFCRMEYLLKLDKEQVNNAFTKTTCLFILSTDKESDKFYNEKIKTFKSNRLKFHVYHFNVNLRDEELTTVEI